MNEVVIYFSVHFHITLDAGKCHMHTHTLTHLQSEIHEHLGVKVLMNN
jgi:hypothetical protein